MKVNTLKLIDKDFPPGLAEISSPPKQIYWAGQSPVTWIDRPKVAIVGSRKLTAYGAGVTRNLATRLSAVGVVIISGLAYGIDVVAHKAALDSGGVTVAVLPSSIEQIYPAAHCNIARHITEQGSLISEYDSTSISFKSNFIARNRLVSGLCDVLLITEAALKSGSLHTARFALEQGKTVMAVPGNITNPNSEGCNNLIKSGAIPVTDVQDILFALKIKPTGTKKQTIIHGSHHEKLIYDLINEGITEQEELSAAANLNGAVLASSLTMLELSGYIRPAGGGNWVIA